MANQAIRLIHIYEAPKSLLQQIFGDDTFLLVKDNTAIYKDQTYVFDNTTRFLLQSHILKKMKRVTHGKKKATPNSSDLSDSSDSSN